MRSMFNNNPHTQSDQTSFGVMIYSAVMARYKKVPPALGLSLMLLLGSAYFGFRYWCWSRSDHLSADIPKFEQVLDIASKDKPQIKRFLFDCAISEMKKTGTSALHEACIRAYGQEKAGRRFGTNVSEGEFTPEMLAAYAIIRHGYNLEDNKPDWNLFAMDFSQLPDSLQVDADNPSRWEAVLVMSDVLALHYSDAPSIVLWNHEMRDLIKQVVTKVVLPWSVEVRREKAAELSNGTASTPDDGRSGDADFNAKIAKQTKLSKRSRKNPAAPVSGRELFKQEAQAYIETYAPIAQR